MITDLLIIRGAPGIGKSTLNKLLSAYFKKGVSIEIDNIRRLKNKVIWNNVEDHLNAIEATGILIISYLKLKYRPIIVFDTLSQGTIKIITDKISSNTTYKIISLIAIEERIKERIIKRNEGFMDFETSFIVNSSIMKEKLENNYLIDTSELSIDEVFKRIIQIT